MQMLEITARIYLYRWKRPPLDPGSPVYSQHQLEASGGEFVCLSRTWARVACVCGRWPPPRDKRACHTPTLNPPPTPPHPHTNLSLEQCGYESGEDRLYLRLPYELKHHIAEGEAGGGGGGGARRHPPLPPPPPTHTPKRARPPAHTHAHTHTHADSPIANWLRPGGMAEDEESEIVVVVRARCRPPTHTRLHQLLARRVAARPPRPALHLLPAPPRPAAAAPPPHTHTTTTPNNPRAHDATNATHPMPPIHPPTATHPPTH